MAGHSAQVHRMLIITEAAKRHRHEAGIHHQSAGPLHPSPPIRLSVPIHL